MRNEERLVVAIEAISNSLMNISNDINMIRVKTEQSQSSFDLNSIACSLSDLTNQIAGDHRKQVDESFQLLYKEIEQKDIELGYLKAQLLVADKEVKTEENVENRRP